MKTLQKTLAFSALFFLFSCSKDDDAPTSATPLPQGAKNIYVSGYEITQNPNAKVAKIWKNGIGTQLSVGLSNAEVYRTIKSGNDIYAVGTDANGGRYKVALWKNGVETFLTDGTYDAYAFAIAFLGQDVYVVGREKNNLNVDNAKIWKNGTLFMNLSDGLGTSSAANDIVIIGNDIYVVGSEVNTSNIELVKVWKNGIATQISDGTKIAAGFSMVINGNDIYVCGFQKRDNTLTSPFQAKFWKNGVITNLTSSVSGESQARNILVIGNDVYTCGYEYNDSKFIAKLWKNDIATDLTNGTYNAEAYSLFYFGNEIYVAGIENNIAKYWNNQTATIVSPNNPNSTCAYSILITN